MPIEPPSRYSTGAPRTIHIDPPSGYPTGAPITTKTELTSKTPNNDPSYDPSDPIRGASTHIPIKISSKEPISNPSSYPYALNIGRKVSTQGII